MDFESGCPVRTRIQVRLFSKYGSGSDHNTRIRNPSLNYCLLAWFAILELEYFAPIITDLEPADSQLYYFKKPKGLVNIVIDYG